MGFLAGKTAIITGAGYAKLSNGRCGSIGYGIATAYAKEGANLVITGRNVKKLTDAKEELKTDVKDHLKDYISQLLNIPIPDVDNQSKHKNEGKEQRK